MDKVTSKEKFDKEYNELFAMYALEHYLPSYSGHLKHRDKPDIVCEDTLGIEVTKLIDEEEGQYIGLWNKNYLKKDDEIDDYEKNFLSKKGAVLIYEDHRLVGLKSMNIKYTVNYERSIDKKIQKLQEYSDMNEYGIYFHVEDDRHQWSALDIVSYLERMQKNMQKNIHIFTFSMDFIFIISK